MSRVYEALQRGRQGADAPRIFRPEPVTERGGVSSPTLPPMSEDGADSATAPPELSSTANGATSGARPILAKADGVACPRCQSVMPTVGVLGVSPIRCTSCGHGFSAEHQPGPTTTPRTVFSTFLRPEDARTFQDVVRDLARDEEESIDRHADDSRKRVKAVGLHSSKQSDGSPHERR